MRNFFFLIGRGIRNIFKNPATSFFSLLVMITTIFLFSVSYAALININAVVRQAESSVGITVFFNDGLTEAQPAGIVTRREITTVRIV